MFLGAPDFARALCNFHSLSQFLTRSNVQSCASDVVPYRTGLATLYRAGMTNVVLHCLFMQQNQRV